MLSYDASHAQEQIEQEIAEIPSGAAVRQRKLPAADRMEFLFARQARKEIRRIVSDFDFVHIHSVWDSICRAALSVVAQSRVPWAVLSNGMLDPWSLAQKSLKKKIALALGMKSLLNRADFIHVGNETEESSIRMLGLTCPVEIIPNGIYPEEFNGLQQGGFFAAHPELKGQPYILFLGRLHHKKGLDFLADAFERVARKRPDVRLVVVGPDNGAREPFEKAIAQKSLSNRVHVIGPLFGRERFSAFRDAACFCLPSRQEGFSVAILEAMACGTPVVISEACNFPEVQTSGAGFVVPLEAGSIADAMDRIVSNPAFGLETGAKGRALVNARFVWPVIASAAIAAYEKAQNRRSKSKPTRASV
jgi:glycosyltransferase involved in cell wall biosynthesis